MARSMADVMAALEAVGHRRRSHVVARDRRSGDMLRALADVEREDAAVERCDREIEALFEERDQLRRQETR